MNTGRKDFLSFWRSQVLEISYSVTLRTFEPIVPKLKLAAIALAIDRAKAD